MKNNDKTPLNSDERAELQRLKERETVCPTLLEAQARALVKALQHIRDELGMDIDSTPAQIVDAVADTRTTLQAIVNQINAA